MKYGNLLAVCAVAFGLIGCGNSSALLNGSGNNSQNPALRNANAVIASGGTTVAYVIGFSSGSFDVYIPSADRYASIFQQSGAYVPTSVYFSGAGCTGTAWVIGYVGVLGKSIVTSNGSNYYLVSTSLAPGSTFTYQSSTQLGTCTTPGGSTTYTVAGYGAAQLTAATQPYNFAAIAPIALTYP